ncbi:unnamed protein product [Effrenium voratum]|nr:unnamed protein product [Effrenium voratum]
MAQLCRLRRTHAASRMHFGSVSLRDGVESLYGTRKVRVFRCPFALDVAQTWRKCVAGAVLSIGALCGGAFTAGLGLSAAAAGVVAPCAVLWWLPFRMREISSRFVEELHIHVPSGDEEAAMPPAEGPAVAPKAAVLASGQLLDAIPELELEILHPGLTRHLLLEEPVKAKPLLRAAGARDPRPRFAELCRLPKGDDNVDRRGLLHINPEEEECPVMRRCCWHCCGATRSWRPRSWTAARRSGP